MLPPSPPPAPSTRPATPTSRPSPSIVSSIVPSGNSGWPGRPHFSSELSTHGCRVAPHLYSWNITTKAIRIGVGMDTACQARKTYSCKFYVNFLVGIFCFIQSISKHIGFLNVFDRRQEKMRNLSRHVTVNFL